MKGFMKQLFTIVMVFAMVLTMMPAGSVAFAMEDGTDVTAEDQLTIDDQTEASEAQDLTVQEPESSDNPDSEEEAPTGDVPSEDAEETESFVLTEEAAEPVANAPEVKAAADENEALPENYKFRTTISSESALGTGSVTGTVYADYNADLVFAGPSVSRTNATLEMWMQNVASLGVDSQRYYKRTVATGLTGDDTPMEGVKAYFNGLNGKTTKIVGKIGDKSTTYTVTREENGNINAVTDEEAAREVWHAIVNEENMTAGTGEDDSYITIANGSYIQIGNQILEFENKDGEDLKLDDFSKLDAMDEQIRAAVALNTAEEMIENVVIYLEPGTILSVGESQVELNKDAKMTIDIDGVDERTLSPILTELKSADNMSQLITKGLGGMSQILTLMGGKTTTVTFEFGHDFGEPTYTWADDNSTVTAVLECSNNEKHNVTETVNTTKEVTAPTCEEAGSVTYTATFKNEAFKAQTKTAAGDPATGHKYGAPEYKWSEDNKTVTATMVCENDKTHVVTETAETVSKTTPATCEEAGSITYTATFKNEAFKAQTKTEAGDPATGHKYGAPEYKWSEDNKTVTATMVCENDKTHVVTETAETVSKTTPATCEEAGSVTYTATFKNEAFKAQTKTEAGDPATGHKYGAPEYKWSEDNKTVTATMVCENDKTHVVTETAETVSKTTPATCEEAGSVTYTATFKNEAFKEQTKTEAGDPATGHKWGEPEWTWSEDKSEATAKFTCETDKNHVKEVKAEITKKEDADTVTYTASVTGPDGKTYTDTKTEAIVYDDILRIFGATRYSTAFKNADRLKEVLGVEKFDTVVVATGVDFPDSLSGAYLANIKDAPMLLISQKDAENVKAYIRNNLKAGGTIYILGGEGAVKDSWLSGLDFTKKRLAGPTRYETNLAILEEVGYTGGDILAATGVDYPDSLSGSYLDMPILLVKGNTLTKDQTAFLKGLKDKPNFYIAGGTGAVSAAMEKTLGTNGTIAKRFAGLDRYETSRLIAEEFYKAPKEVVLAVGTAFPDGLSVGPLAAKMKAPMLLAHNKEKNASASVYTRAKNIRTGVVIGGPLLIWDATAKEVLHNDNIELYEEDKYNN